MPTAANLLKLRRVIPTPRYFTDKFRFPFADEPIIINLGRAEPRSKIRRRIGSTIQRTARSSPVRQADRAGPKPSQRNSFENMDRQGVVEAWH
jgi:hypothetical protein